MATPNRFAIRDAGEATFYDIQTGKVITTLDTIKTADMEFTGETVYARGGYGNSKIVSFSSNKEGSLQLSDALFDKNSISMLTGNALEEGAKTVEHTEKLSVLSNKITLSKTPVGAITSLFVLNSDGTNGEEYTLGDPTTNENEYSITDKQITLHSSVSNNTVFRVYYKVETAADAKYMKVTTDAFGGTFRIVLQAIIKDAADDQLYAAQIEIPRGKFEDNFSMNLSVDGDPSALDMPIEFLRDPVTNELWNLTIYDEDAVQ